MHTFYLPENQNGSGILDETESRHCVRVLRMKNGDTIRLIDGKGGIFSGIITHADAKQCGVEIEKVTGFEKELPYQVHIAVAPTKQTDRLEWFLEKATEIGINEITPVICHRSEKQKLNYSRLNNIMLSAVKQSLRSRLPVLNQSVKFPDLMKTKLKGTRMIAHCHESHKTNMTHAYQKGADAIILIGPEGDFTAEEVNLATELDWAPVSISVNRLRTETAALIACHSIHLINT
jgi:16S rRNA (uracil1498-N3)-methyltransferase